MTFQTGTIVGGYEFIDLLDSSPAGATYQVRNTLAQRYEALKVLPKTLQDDQEKLERFLREVKIHARIRHPNIAAFHNAAQLDGHYVMTTELIEGVTLQDRLENGPLPLEDAINIVLQVLSALEHAHSLGVVHRGITPATLMITPDGVVKLTSFDLAKTATDTQLTQAGLALGPVKYMSPEQVKGLATPDARSDIYSLGAVFYELVTGSPPFEAQSQFDVMAAHVSKAPLPPSHRNPALPPELDAIILAAMAKDPAQRFQTAAQFAAELEKFRSASMRGRPAPRLTVRTYPPAPVAPGALSNAARPAPQAVPVPPPSGSMSGIVAGGALLLVIAAILYLVTGAAR